MFKIIKRYHILKRMLFSILILLTFSSDLVLGAESKSTDQKFVAFTFDDLPIAGADEPVDKIALMTKKLLAGLKAHRIPAIGFVNEKLLYRYGEIDKRIKVLRTWLEAGFELGNHTYSHLSLDVIGLRAYEEDVVRGDTVTKKIMAEMGLKPRYFRHPFLVTGSTLPIQHAFERFLAESGYKVAPVTVDALDWVFNLLYVNAKNKNDTDKMSVIAKEYLNFTNIRINYFENLSKYVLGYQVRQVLLVHANELNADYIDELAKLFEEKNYKFISLDQALQDKAYALSNTCVKPDNSTWLNRWLCTLGLEPNIAPKLPAYILSEFNAAVMKEKDTSRYMYNLEK
jgi:peptidoglycan-N-acetylglucosamine deacetylase